MCVRVGGGGGSHTAQLSFLGYNSCGDFCKWNKKYVKHKACVYTTCNDACIYATSHCSFINGYVHSSLSLTINAVQCTYK